MKDDERRLENRVNALRAQLEKMKLNTKMTPEEAQTIRALKEKVQDLESLVRQMQDNIDAAESYLKNIS